LSRPSSAPSLALPATSGNARDAVGHDLRASYSAWNASGWRGLSGLARPAPVCPGMVLGEGEPRAGPWRVVELSEFARVVLDAVSGSGQRPPIVAVDGRSSSGKTTLARRLEAAVRGAVTVHTDDIAWWHARFAWEELLTIAVLEPLHQGQAVSFRPPAWDERGRRGVIEASAGSALVIIEGVGAGRRETAHLVDAVVWVQADLRGIERRNAARVVAGETTAEDVAGWMEEEYLFVADQRPWERSLVVVAGTPDLPHDPSTQLVLAPSLQPSDL
jgi:uridine kinase